MKNPFSWFASLFSPRQQASVPNETAAALYEKLLYQLREDLEVRVQAAVAEARAFAEEQLHDSRPGQTITAIAERSELRADLASREAKAYADESIGAVASSVSATAKMALHLSRRIDAIENGLRQNEEDKTA